LENGNHKINNYLLIGNISGQRSRMSTKNTKKKGFYRRERGAAQSKKIGEVFSHTNLSTSLCVLCGDSFFENCDSPRLTDTGTPGLLQMAEVLHLL